MSLHEDIQTAARRLREGQLVVFPTETVYGLGANVWDELAVARIFEVKGRPRFDPLIVHIAHREQLDELVRTVPQKAQRLMERFWPGPLTLVLPKQDRVPDIVTAGLPTVAVRQPRHPVAQQLLVTAGVPIAAPSANRFGQLSPTTADHVREQFRGEDIFVLDGGPCQVGVESTVVAVLDDECSVLRYGGVPLEEIEPVVGTVKVGVAVVDRPMAPGQLARHYAPRTPLVLLAEGFPSSYRGRRVGLLTLQPPKDVEAYTAIEVLSQEGDLRQAATRFFAALRRLDAAGLDLIVARPVPEHGLGRAIMDRLRRAAATDDAASSAMSGLDDAGVDRVHYPA